MPPPAELAALALLACGREAAAGRALPLRGAWAAAALLPLRGLRRRLREEPLRRSAAGPCELPDCRPGAAQRADPVLARDVAFDLSAEDADRGGCLPRPRPAPWRVDGAGAAASATTVDLGRLAGSNS